MVSVATELIDQHGADHLTMRRLGAELGTAAMSLYRYIPSREALLDAVADHMGNQLLADSPTALGRAAGWRDLLYHWAYSLWDLSVSHPGTYTLLATRRSRVVWLRPPLAHPAPAETFFAVLLAEGFTQQQAAVTYRQFTSFLTGELAVMPMAPRENVPCDVPSDEPAIGIALQEVRSAMAENRSRADFEDALASLLQRLDLLLSRGDRCFEEHHVSAPGGEH